MTQLPSFILGTAGHIDHGKSTLVQKLTGTDPDRLAEEKRRGITIELGFARLQLPSGAVCGVVDVPGHERFVRHMVEGATGIDLALLVVAADDGVMVQTREHLAILELLGVQSLIIAITKADAVEPDLVELAVLDVAELLSETRFNGANIVVVSAHTGEGIPELLTAIESAAADIKRTASSDIVRLPIDRVFSIEGAGTVVTGTLWDGTIEVDDQLELLHSGLLARVRSIQVHGTARNKARSGQRVALNLSGVKREDIKRGEMLCTPHKLKETGRFIAKLHYRGMPDSNKPLKDGAEVVLHHGTREVKARIKLLFSEDRLSELAAHESAFVQLRLDTRLPLRAADHFIIRNLSPAFTIGGGTVILSDVGQRTKLSPKWFELFESLDTGSITKAVLQFAELKDVPMSSNEIAHRLGGNTSDIARILNQSDLARLKTAKETVYLPKTAVQHMQQRIEEALLGYHKEHPKTLDISQGALRGLVLPSANTPLALAWTEECFEALLIEMAEDGTINFNASKVSHPQAATSVQVLLDEVSEQLLANITKQGLAVMNINEHAAQLEQPREFIAQILGQLHREGKLLRLASEYHFAPQHITAAQEALVSELKTRNTGMAAAEIRDLWQVSRKYAIPLLEYCDAQGITQREGDLRFLK